MQMLNIVQTASAVSGLLCLTLVLLNVKKTLKTSCACSR